VSSYESNTPERIIFVSLVIGLLIWLMGLIFLVEPSPLQTPASMVGAVQSGLRLSEPQARVFATIVLRGFGVGMIGLLLAGVLRGVPLKWAVPAVLCSAPLLALGVKWLQLGYFPIRLQVLSIVAAAVLGGLLGLSLRRSRVALAALALLVVGLLGWGMSTGIGDNLDEAARATGQHLLSQADQVTTGDEAFEQMLEMAFAFAEDNSHGVDPVFTNKAAILALGVILGDDKVAAIGGRELDRAAKEQREALRRRVTIHGRGDLPRHFWVSAALTVLSDKDRALGVGIAKEMADSLPGGSGFSFVDMAANEAGIRLAVVATQDSRSARRLQFRLLTSDRSYRFVPEIAGLPEGLSLTDFQAQYGGLGGEKSRELFREIEQRIQACDGLQ
jgi:hypothetical protein